MDADDILVELECPVCTDYLTIPIRQCVTGHSVCGKCIKKLTVCALCKKEFSESRNITLEGLARKVKYPCINKDAGCEAKLSYEEREAHESSCPHGFKLSCGMSGCTFVGDTEALKTHWRAKNTIYSHIKKDVVHILNGFFKNDLMEAFGELFWIKKKVFQNKVFFAVQFIGKPENARKYFFSVEFCKSNDNFDKLRLIHRSVSIKTPDEALFSDPFYCAAVGFDTLWPYVTNTSSEVHQTPYAIKIFQITAEEVQATNRKQNSVPMKKNLSASSKSNTVDNSSQKKGQSKSKTNQGNQQGQSSSKNVGSSSQKQGQSKPNTNQCNKKTAKQKKEAGNKSTENINADLINLF